MIAVLFDIPTVDTVVLSHDDGVLSVRHGLDSMIVQPTAVAALIKSYET